jgi:phospholipase C
MDMTSIDRRKLLALGAASAALPSAIQKAWAIDAKAPTGTIRDVEHVVVLMQENRSFDHYFGRFGQYAGRTDIEVPPVDATNPEVAGDALAPRHALSRAPHLCFSDTSHSWQASHAQYNEGKNDGFYETNHRAGALQNGTRALSWYDERDIPFYYALAKEFGIGDQYFCSLLGPTWPNRMYLVAGTSFGNSGNTFANIDAHPFPANDAVLFDELEKRHVDWKFFTNGGPPGATAVVGPGIGTRWNRDVVDSLEEFEEAARAGKLPAVAFVDPNYLLTGSVEGEDEHPPSDIQLGQRFVARVVTALTTSPQWKRSALFITYDEHGGIYDHVAPPKACAPDDLAPKDKEGAPVPGAFDRYGFRVPFIVVSPYTKKGYVSHTVYDHTSILRFIQARFRVPALTSRDANAAIPIDFFDFAAPPNLVPPALPSATVNQAELDYCKSAGVE